MVTEVHQHETEVVRKGVCNEKPRRTEVLKPDLWLGERSCTVEQCQPPIQRVRVQLEGRDTLRWLLACRVEDTGAWGKGAAWAGQEVCHVVDLHASERLREVSLLDCPLQQQAVAQPEK